MIRIIDFFLNDWKKEQHRKPLLLRGARQVGKTFSVRTLSKQFDDYVEINFETMPEVIKIFEPDLNATRIIKELSLYVGKKIEPGKTLLFLDETQVFPRSIISLRYFYEQVPQLHVICAGSLLDFAIEQVGVPVGRVSFLYLYPISFAEFLVASGHQQFLKTILTHAPEDFPHFLHQKLMRLVFEYLTVGGMPEAVKTWLDTQDPKKLEQVHSDLVATFKQDFSKYAKRKQIPHVSMIFESVPTMVGKKFKFSEVSKEHRKRELGPALDLLVSANIIHKIFHTNAQGIPLGGQINFEKFKLILLDISLMQFILGWKTSEWAIADVKLSAAKGAVIEAFIGQELLAYDGPHSEPKLYYWHREAKSSNAEVDYIITNDRKILPIEVKSGLTGKLKSLNVFLKEHAEWSTMAVRFSTNFFEKKENISTLPLYAVPALFSERNEYLKRLAQTS